nr:ethylene-responsive transcription factor 5-like [Lolium perenne]
MAATPACCPRPPPSAPPHPVWYRSVHPRPAGTFYEEIRAVGHRIILGTFATTVEDASAYDAAAWRLGPPHRDMNFRDCESLAEAEFKAGAQNLGTAEQRRLTITEADERAM